MKARGRVRNGVVVFEDDVRFPEGAAVIVVPEAVDEPVVAKDCRDRMSEEERRRILAIMDRIAALPIEGKTDPFSARDHDTVLYEKP